MNKYFLLFIILTFIFFKTSFSQIIIDNSSPYDNPTYLVNQELLGNDLSATNINFSGDNVQIGYFDGTNTNLNLPSGIVMSTGNIHQLSPDTAFFANVINNVQDPDLLDLANSVPALIGQSFSVSSVNDIAVLEFDFVATSDTLSFNYVFGSAEYNAYENTGFNDVFGFFVSGPGISGPYSSPAQFPNGAINIAIVPESSPELPITVSSVNNSLNSQFYVPNSPLDSIIAVIRGFTSSMEARTLVQCGELIILNLQLQMAQMPLFRLIFF
jgi:hypothetical protein